MAVYLFKNLYICERGIVNEHLKTILKFNNYWFTTNYNTIESPLDKIILFHNNIFFKHSKLIEVPSNYSIIFSETIGCIKFLMHTNGIQVVYLHLPIDNINESLKIFREYILELVKIYKYNTKLNLDEYKFTLSWNCSIEKDLKNILIQNKLLVPNNYFLINKFYFFTEKDLNST